MLCCSSGACRRAPLCLVHRALLRIVCRVPLRFVSGADSRSIRAPLRRRPRRHLGCRLKRYLSFVSSTFVRCLECHSCAISKAQGVVLCAISAASFRRSSKHQIERCFKRYPYVVPFAFAASPVSPLAPPLTPPLVSCLAPWWCCFRASCQ